MVSPAIPAKAEAFEVERVMPAVFADFLPFSTSICSFSKFPNLMVSPEEAVEVDVSSLA